MSVQNNDNTVLIIGAGFAGLAAGIYARMNGYNTRIFEMHDKPGGLCTAWKRKGYTIDGCIHWFVGSSPDSVMHDYWEEVGVTTNREFINFDRYAIFETEDGRTLTFYSDIDRLEKHLLEFAPEDEDNIREFIAAIRMCLKFDQPSGKTPALKKFAKMIRFFLFLATSGSKLRRWMKVTGKEFAARFRNPALKKAFDEVWFPDFSIVFMFFTFAYLHKRNAGYPLGGSMPLSEALEKRYKDLGGEIEYKKRVVRIITENDKATGIQLDDGTIIRGSRVISAADGYTTIFKMLDGKYTDDKIRHMYENWTMFPPLLFFGAGVDMSFDDVPLSVSGFSFPLKEPVEINGKRLERLAVHLYNHDSSMAPAGKTSLTVMLHADYDYWLNLAADRTAYDREKARITEQIISLLEQRFPGISSKIEMTNLATPVTFERYTGNHKGSFEGWFITPENAETMYKPLSQRLPGLEGCYLCGQWVEPGGGLPTGLMSARRLIKSICREDGKKFRTTTGT